MNDGTLRLLLVEDDEDDVVLIRQLLERALPGLEVQRASSVEEALACARATRFDALLCDYRLGSGNGLELLCEMKTWAAAPVVIFLTGQGDEEVAVQAMRAGASDYLVKAKLSEPALARAISYALALRRKELAVEAAQFNLQASEAALRALFQASPLAIVEFDPEGCIVRRNLAAEQMFGWTNQEVLGHPPPLCHEPLRVFRTIFARALQGECVRGEENTCSRKQGGWINIAVSMAPLCDAAGNTTGVVAVIADITQRKQMEDALRRSEQEYRTLFENANDAVLIFEPSTEIILEANPKALELYGFERDELIGTSLKQLTENVSRGEQQIAELLRQGSYRNFETVQFRKDGTRLAILANSSVIEYRGKAAVLSINRDITELKRAEESLRKLSSAVEQSAEMVLITDREGRIEYVNPAFAQLTGYTREQMLGQTPRLLKSGMHDSEFYRGLWDTLLSGNVFRGVFINKKKSGELYYAEKTITPVRDASGNITHFVSNDRDITARHRAEEELRASEERYRLLFERNLAGVIRTAMDGAILDCNDALARALGYRSRRELLGQDITQFYSCPAERAALVQRLLKEKDLVNVELRCQRANGGSAQMLINMSLREPPGQPPFIEATSIDITERKQLEEQLLQAQKMDAVGQLAGGVAHDFNNLLLVISSYAELLSDSLGTNERLRHNVEEILKAARRAAALTRQLLAFSRKQVMSARVLDLNSVLAEVGRMLPRLIGEHIQVKVVPGADLWQVRADPIQIEQVILNLAVNARDAMPAGGVLTLETRNVHLGDSYISGHAEVLPGDYVLLALSDTGVGIAPEILPHIFEPFFTTKERGKGTGLGLPTVYGIIKQSGGFVWVYSEPGQGTVFKIYLPRVQKEALATSPQAAPVGSIQGSETILLVEDEDAVREVTSEFLTRHGYTVLQAKSGQEALRMGGQFSECIHVLITDVVMPGMNGRDLAEQLRQARTDIKVLFISGYTEATIVERGVTPDSSFLQKPFPLSLLGQRVRELLAVTATPPQATASVV